MRFHVLTIFPNMFESPFNEGILQRAQNNKKISIRVHDIRKFTSDSHRSVDDYPFGGGPGMLMKPQPMFESIECLVNSGTLSESAPKILLTPQGRPLTQEISKELSRHQELLLICARYDGIDERVRQELTTDEISVGDYILSGGELAAMVVIDTVSRLIPGVVGSEQSTKNDSFTSGILQHPQYTRPANFRGNRVPDVLLSGNHKEIEQWRRQESLRRTYERRPDLLDSIELSAEDQMFLKEIELPQIHNDNDG